jgi:calcium binding protein 39
VVAQVANEVYGQDLLSLLVTHLGQFDFEVSQLSGFSSIQLIQRHAKIPPQSIVRYCVERLVLDHLLLNLSLDVLISSLILSRGKLRVAFHGARLELTCRYQDADVALNTGNILKEMLKYEPLARILLYSDE